MASRDISLEFEDWPPVPELHIKERPDPTAEFLKGITQEINAEDVQRMVRAQSHMLSRFEKTNEMLLNFNALSLARYETTANEFQKHTVLLTGMKRDLDAVFQRIRALKTRLSKQHPAAFRQTKVRCTLDEEEEEEEDDLSHPVRNRSNPELHSGDSSHLRADPGPQRAITPPASFTHT